MKKIVYLIIITILSSISFAAITPIQDLEADKNTAINELQDIEADKTPIIENIEEINLTQEESDKEFTEVPINYEYATKEHYNNELNEILSDYKYSPEKIDSYYLSNDIYRPAIGNIVLRSKNIKFLTESIITEKDINIDYDYYHFTAKDLIYKKNKHETYGSGKDINYTTCSNHDHPHWYIHASSVKYSNNNNIFNLRFSNVVFKLGQFNVAWLPVWNTTINKKQAQNFFFVPLLTYSRGNGLGIKFKPTLFENDRFYIDTDFRYSLKNHLRYNIYAHYALDRDFGSNPYIDSIDMGQMIENVNNLGRTSPYKNGILTNEYKNRSHFKAEIGTVFRDNDTTFNGTDVDIYKSVDAYLKYSFDPIGNINNMDLCSLITPNITLNYAREKDEPYIDYFNTKIATSILIPYALGKYKGINIQPIVKFKFTDYKDNSSYKSYSYGIDFSKYYNDQSFWNIRLMDAQESGEPLFKFDSVEHEKGIMASGVKNLSKNFIIGGWIGYNIKKNTTYRIGLMAGIREDCYWANIGYDFKQNKIYSDIEVLGF